MCVSEGEAEAAVKAELGEETGLVEEDLVAVSYMGDELDLETVGDIIAIIEEKVHTETLCNTFKSFFSCWVSFSHLYFYFVSAFHSAQVDDSVEALDAAAVEAALSLCEEAVSEGHTLPGPWETQELKASDPRPTVQDPTSEPQDVTPGASLVPSSIETQTQPETKRDEQSKGNCEGAEVTGSEVTSSINSDNGATGSEVTGEGVAGREVTEATVKSESEEWSQPEPNPPCLGGCCISRTENKNQSPFFMFF